MVFLEHNNHSISGMYNCFDQRNARDGNSLKTNFKQKNEVIIS